MKIFIIGFGNVKTIFNVVLFLLCLKINWLCILFSFFTFQLYSQTTITFKPTNSSEIISYVKVSLKNNSKTFKMFYTDSLGSIDKESLLKTYIIGDSELKADVIDIEAFNYEPKHLSIKELSEIVYLKENTEVLPELIIENIPIITIGDNQAKGKDIGIGILGKSAELVMLFNKSSDGEVNYLKSFNFLIDKRIKKKEFIVRVVVYENKDGLPSKLLFQGQPTILKYKDKGWMKILFENEIEVPETGLFIGIEYVLPLEENSTRTPAFVWRNYNEFIKKDVFMKWEYDDFYNTKEYMERDPLFIEEGFTNMYPVFYLEVFESEN